MKWKISDGGKLVQSQEKGRKAVEAWVSSWWWFTDGSSQQSLSRTISKDSGECLEQVPSQDLRQ